MSDGEKDRESGFKVTDRRLFTPEGEPRGDVDPESTPPPEKDEPAEAPRQQPPEPAPPPPPRREPPTAPPSGEPHPFTAAPGETPQPSVDPASSPDQPEGAAGEIGFSNFLLSLATTAMVGLGEMPDPATGLVAKNVESARQMIDILGILKDKTQGNLDPDETRLLEGLLYELRMKYVATQQGVTPTPGVPPTGSG